MKGVQQRCWAERKSSWLDKNCGFFTVLNTVGCTQAICCGTLWRPSSSSSRRIPWLGNQARARCSPREGSGAQPGFQRSEIPPVSAWRCWRWSNWEISRAASWAPQIAKNYLILPSQSRHPLVILSIKQMELILIINDELFASVIMTGGCRNTAYLWCRSVGCLWMFPLESLLVPLKSTFRNTSFLLFELQISLDRLGSATEQMCTLKFSLLQEVTFT